MLMEDNVSTDAFSSLMLFRQAVKETNKVEVTVVQPGQNKSRKACLKNLMGLILQSSRKMDLPTELKWFTRENEGLIVTSTFLTVYESETSTSWKAKVAEDSKHLNLP